MQKMTLRRDRIEVLQQRLRLVPPEEFDFRVYYRETASGTVGCAAGLFPVIWPEDFCYTENNHRDTVIQNRKTTDTGLSSVATWLGIPFNDVLCLFIPSDEDRPWGKSCGALASPNDVAGLLQRYLDYRETAEGVLCYP